MFGEITIFMKIFQQSNRLLVIGHDNAVYRDKIMFLLFLGVFLLLYHFYYFPLGQFLSGNLENQITELIVLIAGPILLIPISKRVGRFILRNYEEKRRMEFNKDSGLMTVSLTKQSSTELKTYKLSDIKSLTVTLDLEVIPRGRSSRRGMARTSPPSATVFPKVQLDLKNKQIIPFDTDAPYQAKYISTSGTMDYEVDFEKYPIFQLGKNVKDFLKIPMIVPKNTGTVSWSSENK